MGRGADDLINPGAKRHLDNKTKSPALRPAKKQRGKTHGPPVGQQQSLPVGRDKDSREIRLGERISKKLKTLPRKNPFIQEIIAAEETDLKARKDDSLATSSYLKYFGKDLKEEDLSLVERVFDENKLSEEERHMVAKSLQLEDLKLVDQFFQIQFDKNENGFYITKNIKVIGGRDDHEHYTLPSKCILHQESPPYIEKIWLSNGERSRSPERGPSKVVVALDKNGEPQKEGTYFGHSWSFRHRPLGWHNGQYINPKGQAINPQEKHDPPGENSPWPWIGDKTTTIIASRAENSAEAAILYYLDNLETGRTVDRPFKSEGAANEARSEDSIAEKIESVIRGERFAAKLELNHPVQITREEVQEALNSLLERGLIESIRVGQPWKRYSIYKITPKSYLGGLQKIKTQEEKWQDAGVRLRP